MKFIVIVLSGVMCLTSCINIKPKGVASLSQSSLNQYFLERLHALATTADLSYYTSVSETLQLDLMGKERKTISKNVSCMLGSVDRAIQWDQVSSTTTSWYRTIPSQASQNTHRPIYDQTPHSADARVIFYTIQNEHCVDTYTPKYESIGTVTFSNVWAFACISPQSLERYFPNTERIVKNLGDPTRSTYSYTGKPDQYTGKHVEVEFNPDLSCAQEISVTQDPKYGLGKLQDLSK